MVSIKQGNLLDSDAQTLVNTVNCVGVMGKGIALEFKKRFPAMFDDYVKRCVSSQVKLGQPYLFIQLFPPNIINFPTKDHWRSVARLEDIVEGLQYLEAHYKEWGITSLAVPPLGCGNGQLEWQVVGPTLHRHLSRFDIPVELFAPVGTPHNEMQTSFLEKPTASTQPLRINPGWIPVLEVLKRLDEQPYHWPIGRTVFQKVLFVGTRLGIPTELRFSRSSYGPYSSGVKHLQSRLMNHGLLHERRVGDRYEVSVGTTFDDARLAYSQVIHEWEKEIERTVDLFMRVGTANQAELVATVLYASDELSNRGESSAPPSEDDVFEAVQSWKIRRHPPLNPVDIRGTIGMLASQNWINVLPSQEHEIEEWDLAVV